MNSKNNLLLSSALASCMLFAAGHGHAAIITWGSATDVATTTDVSTAGTTVEALNLGYKADDLSTVTVNGVQFTALVAPSPLTGTTTFAQAQLGGNSSGNAPYDNLLNTVAFGGGADLVNMTVGGGNLVDGNQYQIQLWFVDERTSPADTSGRVMQYGDGNGNTVNLGGTSGLLGQYVIGTFTANGANQTLTMDAQGFGNAHLTAYQIRAIPEPHSAGLLALLAGMALLRRRR